MDQCQLFSAEVVEYLPNRRACRCNTPLGVSTVHLSSSLSDVGWSAEQGGPLPGTWLAVAKIGSMLLGFASLPRLVPEDVTLAVPRPSVPGSGVGEADEHHKWLLHSDMHMPRAVADGAASDSIAGESGDLSAVGVGVLRSLFYSSLRASPVVDVSVHYLQQLLRLWGYNLDLFTAGSARQCRTAGDTVFDREQYASHVAAALGVEAGNNAFAERENELINDSATQGALAPAEEQQLQLFDLEILRGTTAQGQVMTVRAPAADLELPAALGENQQVGLLSEHVANDGSYSLRTARSLLLMKTPTVPLLTPAVDPANLQGEGSADYTPAAEYSAPGLNPMLWARDKAAYDVGTRFQALARAQKTDWQAQGGADVAKALDADKLTKTSPAADAAEVEIQTCDGGKRVRVKIGLAEAFMLFTDGGSVVIEDGSGSQLSLHNGTMTFTSADRMVFRPGTDFEVIAPGDVILRGGNNIEASTTNGNVRVKAERELQMLAGNGGFGGIVMESRATGSGLNYKGVTGDLVSGSGIIMKCPESAVAVWAPDIFLQSRKVGDRAAGVLSLSSEGTIFSEGRDILEKVKLNRCTLFGDGKAVHVLHAQGYNISKGSLTVDGSGTFTGGGLMATGQIAGASFAHDGKSPTMVPGANGQIKKSLTAFDEEMTEVLTGVKDAIKNVDKQLEQSPFVSVSSVENVGFSFRIDSQYPYGAEQYPEAGWQRMLAETGSPWVEKPVMAPGGAATFPAPGSAWNNTPVTGIMPVAYDPKTGIINSEVTTPSPEETRKSYVTPRGV